MSEPNLGEKTYSLSLKNTLPVMARIWENVHGVREEIILTLKRGQVKLLDAAPSWYKTTLENSERLMSTLARSNVMNIKEKVKNDMILESADYFLYLRTVARDLINAILNFLSGSYTMAGKGPIPGSNMARHRRPPHKTNRAKKK